MKKFSILFGLILTAFAGVIFAEKTSVECSSDQVFEDNTCHVCFTDTAESDTNTLDITGIQIPWENKQDTVSEVAYKIENVVPEVITKLDVVMTPSDAKDVWKFTNPWVGNLNEFVLGKDGKTTFIEMNKDAKIAITDTDDEDKTVLVRAPLIYHERTIATPITESEAEKTRNICVLYATKFGPAPEPKVMSSEVTIDEPEEKPAEEVLDSAPEEDTTSEEKPAEEEIQSYTPDLNSADDTMNPTDVETGPAEMIFFLFAVSISFGLLAWRKNYI